MPSAMLHVFDLDGTLLDSRDLAVDAVREACRQAFSAAGLRHPLPDDEAILACVGLPAPDFHDRLLASFPERIRRDAETRCERIEADLIRQGRMRLFPDVPKVLERLVGEGHPLAVASNCAPDYLAESLLRCDLRRHFVEALCPALRDGASKGELVKELVDRFGLPAVMIGDRRSDGEAAARAGIPFWGCGWGFGNLEELDAADRLLRGMADLLGE